MSSWRSPRPKSYRLKFWNLRFSQLSLAVLTGWLSAGWLSLHEEVHANPVRAANDGTGTAVQRNGDRFEINGGRRSRDGGNLFHSLEQFGLSREQVATFQSSPDVRNILTRITGGDVSIIDGLIQVSGGNSNLYLMNPAGIVFGQNARLNVPASFTATTATGIGLEGNWFSAIANNDYAALVGTPSNYAFALEQPGSVINAGNLSVGSGQRLTLMGGNVLNVGQLTAPGGQVILTAVPGQSRVRMSQMGSPLSLEIESATTDPPLALSPLSLPQLLTGGDVQSATNLMVSPTGTILLGGSTVQLPTEGSSAIASNTINVSSTTGQGGMVLVTGDRTAVIDAAINANGAIGGGTILIGGEYQGGGAIVAANQTLVSVNSLLQADALTAGNGGRVILWADDATSFWGSITARGSALSPNVPGSSFAGGFVEVSGRETLQFRGTVDVSAANGQTGTLLLDPRDILISADTPLIGQSPPTLIITSQSNEVKTDITLFADDLAGITGNIQIQASRDITIQKADLSLLFSSAILLGEDSISFEAGRDFTANRSLNSNGRNLSILAGRNIVTQDLTTSSLRNGGDLTLRATEDITTGNIDAGQGRLPAPLSSDSGDVTLTSTRGNIQVNSIDTRSERSPEFRGSVTLQADTVRVFGSIPDLSGTSIASQTVTIDHAGGVNNVPFIVGDASLNGTTGSIAIASGQLDPADLSRPVAFPVSPNGGDAATNLSGLTVRSRNSAPSLIVNGDAIKKTNREITLDGQVGQAIAIQIPSGTNWSAQDVNNDNTAFIIRRIAAGGRITRNGQELKPNDRLSAGDILQYESSHNSQGEQFALEVVAVDFDNGNLRLSDSNPLEYRVRLAQAPPVTTTPIEPSKNEPPATAPLEVPEVVVPNLAQVSELASPTDLDLNTVDQTLLENSNTEAFANYFGLNQTEVKTVAQTQETIRGIARRTGIQSGLVYLDFAPEGLSLGGETNQGYSSDRLELTLITAEGQVRQRVEVTRGEFLATVAEFRSGITDVRQLQSQAYLVSAQKLYQWIVAPLDRQLSQQQIGNLIFIPENGLRSLPYAALHDGKQFLVEKYSVNIMPSMSLTNTDYHDIRDADVLAVGVSESIRGEIPLPTVPTELSTLLHYWQGGRSLLNQDATLNNLRTSRQNQPYGIIHLATHANFITEDNNKSYIQLWDDRLRLDQLRQLGWNDPPVELLVLSACRTALGDEKTELGFAGLAVQAGVKTVVASLWYVNDAATTALMSKFYEQLHQSPIKAEALRQTQIAMIRGEVRIERGQMLGLQGFESVVLPGLEMEGDRALSHPYYWAAFTMVGNPW